MSENYELHATPKTVHWGQFDASLKPVLRIKSGDRVTLHSVNGEPAMMPAAPFKILPEQNDIFQNCTKGLGPHILTGPIWIEGAMPGDALEVRVLNVSLRQDWGYNFIRPLSGTLPEEFPIWRVLHIPINRDTMEADLPWGIRISLKPFFGIMGVAPPPAYGVINSVVPREHGGNVDLKELGVGATLYLPVWTEGALFSAGDGHAVQGDGEVCLTALETALSGTFEFAVRKDLRLTFPRAETASHLISMGFNTDLDDAAKQAVREMIRIICERYKMAPEDAYTLCSLAADFRVTQLVDGNKGIHGMLAKEIFRTFA